MFGTMFFLPRARFAALPRTRAMSSSVPPLVQNLVRPKDWKATAPAAPAGTSTYGQQAKLGRLPVPELKDTFSRLAESLAPLARNAAELSATQAKISAFADGLAPQLQERLKARQVETANWLEDWWDDGAYLGYRDSVVVNVSYFYAFDDALASAGTNAAVASHLVRSALLFRRKLKRGEVTPDVTKDGPHCMDTWRWMFDACRIPGAQGLDWSVSAAKAGDTGDFGHIIVLRQGRFWKVDISNGDQLLGSNDLQSQIQYIYDHTKHEYPAVGILAAANRDLWAKDYAALASDPHNASILEAIHSSAFILCLDTEKPNDIVALSRYTWHGAHEPNSPLGLRNRWVDKPCQFIVYDNGKTAFMGEHSIIDGTPTVRMCSEALDALKNPSFDHGSEIATTLPPPAALDWNVSAETERAIGRATNEARELVGSQTLGYRTTSYGKKVIKTFGVSPDSWAQMIIQLAYARLLRALGKLREGGTYESATTRKFAKGRTEVIRVVSAESDRWVTSMDDASISGQERRDLFARATQKHIERARLAGSGQGVDRHLLGLRSLVLPDEDVPALYADALFGRAKNWVLSTSALNSQYCIGYGWGEVVPEGFGVAYLTCYDDRLQFNVTSRKEMPNEQFCDEIIKASNDMFRLFNEVATLKSKL